MVTPRLASALRRLVPALLLAIATTPASAQAPSQPAPGPADTAVTPASTTLAAQPQVTAALTPADLTAFLDGLIPTQLERDDVAGAVVAVMQDGQPLLVKGYGYADWKKKTTIDPATTTFRPGSISKLPTYVAMMQQVEAGKLSLDTDIAQYLDFPIRPGDHGIGAAPITLRQLATHTAGFEEENRDFGSDASGRLPLDLRTFLIRNQPHRFAAPGTALAYSNYGITLIGYIVQRVSGEPYADYVQRHIFSPLGMDHSTYVQPLPATLSRSLGYSATAKDDNGFEGVTESPAGGLSTTATDMLRFGQMLLAGGILNGKQVLTPASVALFFTPQFSPAPTPAPGVTPWNLGFYPIRRNGYTFTGHGGDLIAFHSEFWVEPTHHLIFFISYNSAGSAKIARDQLFRAFVDRYLPLPPGTPAHPAYQQLSAADLKPYTGTYLSARRADSTRLSLQRLTDQRLVRATPEGNLTNSSLKSFRDGPSPLHPIGGDSFWNEDGQFVVHFTRDSHGNIDGYVNPSRVDRVSPLLNPVFLSLAALFALATLFFVLAAPLLRTWQRLFSRERGTVVLVPGTMWLPFTVQLAFAAVLVLLASFVVLLIRLAGSDTLWGVGHLDTFFTVQTVIAALTLAAILLALVSTLRALRLPLRLFTKIKLFAVAAALLLCATPILAFHLIGNPHRY